MNTLGIGRNSTLLNTLFSAGAIASRTWSYWHGWAGAESQHQIDGNLTVGGYDAAKTLGTNVTLPFTNSEPENCPSGYIVTITEIKMNLKNGSSPSILGASNKGSAMRACVDGLFPTMMLSEDI